MLGVREVNNWVTSCGVFCYTSLLARGRLLGLVGFSRRFDGRS